jgi:hypothetical protein
MVASKPELQETVPVGMVDGATTAVTGSVRQLQQCPSVFAVEGITEIVYEPTAPDIADESDGHRCVDGWQGSGRRCRCIATSIVGERRGPASPGSGFRRM